MGKVFKALNKAQLTDEPEADKPNVIESTAVQPHSPLRDLERQVQSATTESSLFEKTLEGDSAMRKIDERLVTITASSSTVAESFRRLRNRILHPTDGKPMRTVLVTSALPEEGKGFVCANLAIIMAQGMEQHALMIEGDLRRPTLASLFGLNNDRGLVNYLQDGEDISTLIKDTGFKKLSIIPSGPPPINPAELLDSTKMSSIVEELVKQYHDRFIIVDSPPMTAASEIAVLAKYVDGVILVVRWRRSRREQVKALVDLIGEEKIVGVVFNAYEMGKLESKLQRQYQDYYDSYNNGYY